MKWLWNTFLYQPLYNALILFVSLMPGNSLAVSIIILTVIVRLILSPLSKRATLNQIKQREIQPKIDEIKENIKDPKKQGEEMLKIYKENKLNPFSGLLLLFIQIPIILALYHVFQGGAVEIPGMLYPFVKYPESINITLFKIINLSEKSIILALFAGISQYIQIKFSPNLNQNKGKKDLTKQEKTIQSIQQKMMFTMPIVITAFAYFLPAAIALYWGISNLFTLSQEIIIRKKIEKDKIEKISSVENLVHN